jgi:hypothetical protein
MSDISLDSCPFILIRKKFNERSKDKPGSIFSGFDCHILDKTRCCSNISYFSSLISHLSFSRAAWMIEINPAKWLSEKAFFKRSGMKKTILLWKEEQQKRQKVKKAKHYIVPAIELRSSAWKPVRLPLSYMCSSISSISITLDNILIAFIRICFLALIFHHPSIHHPLWNPDNQHLMQNILDDKKFRLTSG